MYTYEHSKTTEKPGVLSFSPWVGCQTHVRERKRERKKERKKEREKEREKKREKKSKHPS